MSSPAASSFESALAAANECFVGEEYEEAAALYDAALRLQPSNAAALVARAANNIKRKQYNGQTQRLLQPNARSIIPLLPRGLPACLPVRFRLALPSVLRVDDETTDSPTLPVRQSTIKY